jgi:hypothetical protein
MSMGDWRERAVGERKRCGGGVGTEMLDDLREELGGKCDE